MFWDLAGATVWQQGRCNAKPGRTNLTHLYVKGYLSRLCSSYLLTDPYPSALWAYSHSRVIHVVHRAHRKFGFYTESGSYSDCNYPSILCEIKNVSCTTVQCHEVLCEFVMNRSSCVVAGRSIEEAPSRLIYLYYTFANSSVWDSYIKASIVLFRHILEHSNQFQSQSIFLSYNSNGSERAIRCIKLLWIKINTKGWLHPNRPLP